MKQRIVIVGSGISGLSAAWLLNNIWRFGRIGAAKLDNEPDPSATVGEFLKDKNFGDAFGTFFLLPMAAAIWSTGTGPSADFPRDTLLRFFSNHGLLSITGQPEWRTVRDGSSTYIDEMTRGFAERVHLGSSINSIQRHANEIALHLADGSTDRFDHAVIATHADHALALLADPTEAERELLGSWRYSDNDTWLHTDTTLMPRRRRARASWNYLIENGQKTHSRCLRQLSPQPATAPGQRHRIFGTLQLVLARPEGGSARGIVSANSVTVGMKS